MVMEYGEAIAELDRHVNVEALPPRGAELRLETIRRLTELMDHPQRQYPVLHLTGTNGKTTTARVLTALLTASGLSVGTVTSPHLTKVNERMAWNGDPIADDDFGELIGDVLAYEPLLDRPPNWFELLIAASFRWFADIAVDAAVIEVGLGGRFDATNVADGTVAVVTNVGLDHVEYIGPTRIDIAIEKAGIVKPGSTCILGETEPELKRPFLEAGAGAVWERGEDWGCDAARVALGGRVLDLHTPGARYDGVFLPLHGAHQGHNAAAALAAAEAFFGRPIDPGVVTEAFRSVRSPGRLEVVGRKPLRILDGAHNADGARAIGATLGEEFAVAGRRIYVLGVMRGHDPLDLLQALGTENVALVVACAPDTPRAVPVAEIAEAARRLGLEAEVGRSVADAVRRATDAATPDDLVLITGSLYTVGAARSSLHLAD